MPGRQFNSGDYRYGFNGMEKDDEVNGNGNSYTTEFRQYDSRIGRWLSIDPLVGDYPEYSPYSAFNNNPIYYVDPLGLEGECKTCPKENNKEGQKHIAKETHVNPLDGMDMSINVDYNYHSGSGSNEAGWYNNQDYGKMIFNAGKATGYANEAGYQKGISDWTGDGRDFDPAAAQFGGVYSAGKAAGHSNYHLMRSGTTYSTSLEFDVTLFATGFYALRVATKGITKTIADDAFVHVTTHGGAANILSKGLNPEISGFVTKWKYVKNVTNPSEFNTMLYS